ncbi:MAG: alcohol dehydrogenase catalytic domain-containing protein, partial [Chloroflexi bacterium]|nr:alcohol dehydrogenase catalytic domain-containing protein [Chloroflexota bacterium]
MKAVAKTEPGRGARLVDVDVPRPGPREVLLKIKVAAICGSDVHVWEWVPQVASSSLKLPLTMGHEYCATVEEAGPEVTRVKVGDRVAGETHFPCGVCYQCRTGKQHICRNVKIVGRQINGCLAEYAVVPEICVSRVPDDVNDDVAAVMEPLACGVRPMLETEVGGNTVAVLGCGPIGLFAIGGARALGASEVFATNRSELRLSLARKMGATALINPAHDDVVKKVLERTDGDGVDVVMESSGSPQALKQGFQVLKKGGTMLVVVIPP